MSFVQRNHSVTIAKAIAIISMVLFHAGGPAILTKYGSMYHMPLFFFMSGYCFKPEYLYESKKWFYKRVKGIYWPYVKWGIVFVLLHNVMLDFHIYSTVFEFNGKAMHYYPPQEMLKKLLSVCTMHGTERLLGGFWFLRALFWGSIIFYVFRKVVNNALVGASILLVLTLLTSYFNWRIPYFHIGSSYIFAAFFIMVGHYMRFAQWKGTQLNERVVKNWKLILLFAVVVGVGSVYWPAHLLHYKWNQVLPNAVTSILDTYIIFALGGWINEWANETPNILVRKMKNGIRDFLVYTGDNTLNVLTWHFLSFKLVSLLIICLYSLSIDQLGDFPTISSYAQSGFWLLYWFAGVIIPILGTYIYHKIADKE